MTSLTVKWENHTELAEEQTEVMIVSFRPDKKPRDDAEWYKLLSNYLKTTSATIHGCEEENKYMEIREAGTSHSGKTKIWNIYDRGSGEYLARIMWSSRGRSYVLVTDEGNIDTGVEWWSSCLRYVSDFIDKQMKLRKEER